MNPVSLAPSGHADVSRPRPDSAASTRSILVVDDEAAIRLMFSALLRRYGYEVRTAAGFDEALASLRQRTPDMVLLDVRMPGRSGLELLRQIRYTRHWHHVPVLLVTGAPLDEEEQATVRALSAYVFYKPEHPSRIVEQLQRLACAPVLRTGMACPA